LASRNLVSAADEVIFQSITSLKGVTEDVDQRKQGRTAVGIRHFRDSEDGGDNNKGKKKGAKDGNGDIKNDEKKYKGSVHFPSARLTLSDNWGIRICAILWIIFPMLFFILVHTYAGWHMTVSSFTVLVALWHDSLFTYLITNVTNPDMAGIKRPDGSSMATSPGMPAGISMIAGSLAAFPAMHYKSVWMKFIGLPLLGTPIFQTLTKDHTAAQVAVGFLLGICFMGIFYYSAWGLATKYPDILPYKGYLGCLTNDFLPGWEARQIEKRRTRQSAWLAVEDQKNVASGERNGAVPHGSPSAAHAWNSSGFLEHLRGDK